MKLKKFIWIYILIFFTSCNAYRETGKVDINNIYLDYIFYKSLNYAYKNDSIFINDISSSVYMDLSGSSILEELGEFLDSEAKRRASSVEPINYIDYEGKKSTFYDLLELYKDKKLSKKILMEIKKIKSKNSFDY